MHLGHSVARGVAAGGGAGATEIGVAFAAFMVLEWVLLLVM